MIEVNFLILTVLYEVILTNYDMLINLMSTDLDRIRLILKEIVSNNYQVE